MKHFKHLLASLLCAGIVATFGMTVSVADDDKEQREHDAIRAALQRGDALPLVRILAITQQAVPGDVIEVELERKRDALVYEIKVLTETGRVRELSIDARTGAVLKIEDE